MVAACNLDPLAKRGGSNCKGRGKKFCCARNDRTGQGKSFFIWAQPSPLRARGAKPLSSFDFYVFSCSLWAI